VIKGGTIKDAGKPLPKAVAEQDPLTFVAWLLLTHPADLLPAMALLCAMEVHHFYY